MVASRHRLTRFPALFHGRLQLLTLGITAGFVTGAVLTARWVFRSLRQRGSNRVLALAAGTGVGLGMVAAAFVAVTTALGLF